MNFSECGNSLNNGSHWASMIFNECTNVLLTDVHINDPVGYGIIALDTIFWKIFLSIWGGKKAYTIQALPVVMECI